MVKRAALRHRNSAVTADFESASRSLRHLDQFAPELETRILGFISAYEQSDRRGVTEELLALPLTKFPTLKVVRAALAVAHRADRIPEFVSKFAHFCETGSPIPQWRFDDRLKNFKKDFSSSVVDLLLSIKYAQSPGDFKDLVQAIDFYAQRFRVSESIVDALHRATSVVGLDEAEFTDRLKKGSVSDHVLNDLYRRRVDTGSIVPRIQTSYKALWAEKSFEPPAVTKQEGKRRPTIFLTCHSAVMDHVKFWFKSVFHDGVRVGAGVSDKITSSRENPNAALLEAYRFVMQGRPVLIAADSGMGAAKNTLSVLQRAIPVADGFVFLAFESHADVFWTSVVPRGGHLVLSNVQGPRREAGEKIKAYRQRLLSFVEAQLAAYFTGPPEEIGLRKKWVDIMGEPVESGKDAIHEHDATA